MKFQGHPHDNRSLQPIPKKCNSFQIQWLLTSCFSCCHRRRKVNLILLVSGSTERGEERKRVGKAQIFSQFSTAFSEKNISLPSLLARESWSSRSQRGATLIHSISDSFPLPSLSCRYCIAESVWGSAPTWQSEGT